MTPPSLHLEQLTWPQVRSALEAGYRTAVFAAGATEQHGPHLPLLVDAEIGTDLALQVARSLGNTLVAPTIRVGCSPHHMAFAGSLSLRRETFQSVVEDYCDSLAHHGFRHIVIIPSHGGNFVPLADMLPDLRQRLGNDTTVWAFTDLMGLADTWQRVVEETVGLGDRVGGHADIAETSILQTICPELVQEDQAAAGFLGSPDANQLRKILAEGLHTVTDCGILGDARGSSAHIGRACQAAVVELILEHYRTHRDGAPA